MSIEQDTFIISEHALLNVVHQITDTQWDQKVSEPLAAGRDITLRALINTHAYDDVWVPDTLAGKTIEEVGEKYNGDLLGDNPKTRFADIVDRSIQAIEGIADLDALVHLTYGDYPIREYLKHITTFRGFRTYTIAKYIGVDSSLPPALVQGLWDEVLPELEQWRSMHVFGPEIPVPADADQQTKLLGLTGFYQA